MSSVLILAFGVVLMIAVLVSERAHRTVLSTSVLFLVAGFLIGGGALGWVRLGVEDPTISGFAELALFVILIVDATRLPLRELTRAWSLPGRALLLGMPLTLGAIALAGRLLLGMSWTEALLVGAILSPTDPALVTAILERKAVPLRLRRLLAVESGLNDGIALPAVMVLLALAGHHEPHLVRVLFETALGVVLGVAVAAALLFLERRRFFGATQAYEPLAGIAIAAVTYGLSRILHANEFLAAFSAGVTIATMRPRFASALRRLGRPIAEALKLATLLLFGAVLRSSFLGATGLAGVAFALTALLATRPLAFVFALLGRGLTRQEWFTAAWFGPKGFASLLYALLMLNAGIDRGVWLFQVLALVIVMSIVAHSSTDSMVAGAFARRPRA